ncbi:hypothetical protein [Microbulbifer sp. MCCC 1A16149]|uniref:hypothetical protein n=1 Tax=Microbulbifer sp. MCCC 1A16149 TaxID=3411322 RepID=UPI003D0D357F
MLQSISEFLANPLVGLLGFTLSAVASAIAIFQAVGKSKANKEVDRLSAQLIHISNEHNELKVRTNNPDNRNKISQGDKSQYFQDNSGPVHIDNRG